jgi:hyperosmotically inducible periplasmic protein
MAGRVARISQVCLWLSLVTFAAYSPVLAQQPAGDNTRANKTDKPTADQQKNNQSDTTITRDIRRSVVGDKTLSTYAHNIKIVTRHGDVTLTGPVRTADEKKAIETKATEIAGAGHVTNNLSVTPPKDHARN